MASGVTLADLGRDPGEVARRLAAWHRGEPDEAALATLGASAAEMTRSGYTLWAWAGRTPGGEPAWALPITSTRAADFAPRGPAKALVRCLEAAVGAGGDPDRMRLEDWHGFTCLVAPGLEEVLAATALEEAHPAPGRARLATLPEAVALGGRAIDLQPDPDSRGAGLAALARALSLHPVTAALRLLSAGPSATEIPDDPRDLVQLLRDRGPVALASAPEDEPIGLAIEDDPCPRRRHARRVLRRLLAKGKIGGYHTEIGHFIRGLPDHEKSDAKDVVEALLRAGLLLQKPSVGQRHISLSRESLPQIHALIERAETLDPQLAEMWTAPAPTGSREP